MIHKVLLIFLTGQNKLSIEKNFISLSQGKPLQNFLLKLDCRRQYFCYFYFLKTSQRRTPMVIL